MDSAHRTINTVMSMSSGDIDSLDYNELVQWRLFFATHSSDPNLHMVSYRSRRLLLGEFRRVHRRLVHNQQEEEKKTAANDEAHEEDEVERNDAKLMELSNDDIFKMDRQETAAWKVALGFVARTSFQAHKMFIQHRDKLRALNDAITRERT
eukprot:827279_1